MLFCQGAVTDAKRRKCFKEKIVAAMSNISDMEKEDKNRQVISGFGNVESLLTSIRTGVAVWLGQRPCSSERKRQGKGKHRNSVTIINIFKKFAIKGIMGLLWELEGI